MGGRFGHRQRTKTASHVWTNEDDKSLLEMAAEGWSRIEIARRLGITKNAVIGRLYRHAKKAPENEPTSTPDQYGHVPPAPSPPYGRFSHWLFIDKDNIARRGFTVMNDGYDQYLREANTNAVFIVNRKKYSGSLIRTVKNDFDLSDAALLEIEQCFPRDRDFNKSAYEQ